VLYFPPGTYRFDRRVAVSPPEGAELQITIRGDGRGVTRLLGRNAEGDIKLTPVANSQAGHDRDKVDGGKLRLFSSFTAFSSGAEPLHVINPGGRALCVDRVRRRRHGRPASKCGQCRQRGERGAVK
jgi:hypothetical protein